jgi:pimeloyl-ACP methyl ester carboxylesterase
MRKVRGVAVDIRGVDDDRPPLVLLHGLTFDHTMWEPALAELESIDADRRVVSFQLPGHGESDPLPSYALDLVADAVHDAVVELGLSAPVMVGHSLSGALVGVYGARHDVAGIVNVDQPLDIGPFVAIMHSIGEQLRGPAFPSMWQVFADSWHVEDLPPSAQEIVRGTCDPRQDLVVGYWRDAMERDPAEMEQFVTDTLATLREKRTRVRAVFGAVEQAALEHMREHVPQAEIDVWPDSGHFPHLAHPDQFAAILAATAAWR